MTPILLRDLKLRKGREHYYLRIHPVGQEPIEVETDHNLGHLMSAWSVVLKEVLARERCEARTPTTGLTGTIWLDEFRIEPLIVQPWRWKIRMVSGRFIFECNVDSAVENVTNALAAAMKFFGQKYGVIEIFPEVAYNRDVAGELGLLEGHA